MTLLEKQLAEALRDAYQELIPRLPFMHPVKVAAMEALENYDRQLTQETNNVHY